MGKIWPNKERCDIPADSPALPQVDSYAETLAAFGPNDYRTWRADYFERRLKIADHKYRAEHSTIVDVKKRGCIFNVWTGATAQLYGMSEGSFRCLVWPGVGCERIGEQCGYGNENEATDIHAHGPHTDEVITMFRGEGEGYISDHWMPMAEGGDFLYVTQNGLHGMRSAGMSDRTTYRKGWVGTGMAAPAQWELYTKFSQIIVDPEAEKKGYGHVFKFANNDNGKFGLVGTADYLNYPGNKALEGGK